MSKREHVRFSNGKWYAVVYFKDSYGFSRQKWLRLNLSNNANKEQVAESAKEATRQFELEKNRRIFASFKKGKKIASKISFFKFVDLWLSTIKKNVEVDTFDDYCFEIKIIKNYFFAIDSHLTMRDILPLQIAEFYDYLYQKGLSSNTVARYHILFNQIFKFAVKNDILPYNLMGKVDRPKKVKYEPKYYSALQMRSLVCALQASNLATKVPILLASTYGLRRSEVVGLLWSSVDFENKVIHINNKVIETCKNGKTYRYSSHNMKNESSKRDLPLLPDMEKILLHAKQERQKNKAQYGPKYKKKYANFVCVDKFGNLISPHRITTSFAKFLKKNHFPPIRFHDLRHSCASILVQNGVSMKAIQEWLGHSNFSTTANTYSHLDYSSKVKSGEKIEELIYCKNDDVVCKNQMCEQKNIAQCNLQTDAHNCKADVLKPQKLQSNQLLLADSDMQKIATSNFWNDDFFNTQSTILLQIQKIEQKIDSLIEQTAVLSSQIVSLKKFEAFKS